MKDYKAIFDAIEATILREGSKNLSTSTIRESLDTFKFAYNDKQFTDDEYYRTMVFIVFASGFKAVTTDAKKEVIFGHFPEYRKVAAYEQNHIKKILQDPQMIKNERKITACVKNARMFETIIAQYGSFKSYVDAYNPDKGLEGIMLLREDLDCRFEGLGGITAYHFLTDIGIPVIKPDRVICRIFSRLGLIESEKHILHAQFQAKKFVEATGYPPRYIDIVFVAYGQMKKHRQTTFDRFGLDLDICAEKKPHCNKCGATQYCDYFQTAG